MPSQTYGESMLNSVDFMNLYIKNLDTHVTNDDLSQLFRKYGRIVSARVMTNQTGQSKGYGFVSFAKPEEAAAALQEMNGYILANRPLTVSYHEPKKKVNSNNNNNNNSNNFNHNNNMSALMITTVPTNRPIIYDKPNSNDIVGLGIVDQLGMRDLSIGQRSPPKMVNTLPPSIIHHHQQQQQQQHPFHYHHQQHTPSHPPFQQQQQQQQQQQPPTPPITVVQPDYSRYGSNSIVRRNSNESVMTETTAKVQRIKLNTAVRHCGNYGRITEEIVDMLMTLKRKERSLCLFNQEYLKGKVQLAVDALTTCDSDEEDSYVDMDYGNNNNIKRESKVIVPPTPTPPLLSISKGVKVETLIASFEGKPLHEKKQLLGDQLFPLVKATGTKQAPKVTICLLDTVDLYELASIMYNGPVLKRRVEEAFSSIKA